MSKAKKSGTKDYILLTIEENNALKVKNENLVQRVRNTTNYISDIQEVVKNKQKEVLDLKEWKEYLYCDHIPKPFEPLQNRSFFYKTYLREEEDIELTMNWLLAVDERSILSQNIDTVNLTKDYLREEQGNFGDKYDVRVNEAIEISKRIQNYLETPTHPVSKRILGDVEEMKFTAYAEINKYIDNLTYRILCSEDAYMKDIDVTTAEYSYRGKNFDIHLWTFKNVPIYLDPSDTPKKSIYLHTINTKLVMPFSVLSANMVIRGLHCSFDHFSAYARFFELPFIADLEKNLTKCLQNEWKTQTQIQADVRTRLIKKRLEFEEIQRIKQEEEEAKAKLRKKEEAGKPQQPDKKGAKKPVKEPQILTPNDMPFVREDFLQFDLKEYEDAMLKVHPKTFKLVRGEINLRKFQILGGVYKLNSLSKPNVVNFPKLIMTWYKSNTRVEYNHIQPEFSTSKSQSDIAQFFKITFELPECFCQWGEPIPCLFEEGQTYRPPDAQNKTDDGIDLTVGTPIIINDFNLHELFTKPLMYDFIENSIPRLISSFNLPEDLVDEDEDKKAKPALGRTKITAEQIEREKELMLQKQMLSYDIQQAPERLFPLFKKMVPVVVLPIDEEFKKSRTHLYEHFSEFITALQSIMDSYRRTKFVDVLGNPVQVLAEKYEKNIRRPHLISKYVMYDVTDSRQSIVGSETSLNQSKRSSVLTVEDAASQTSATEKIAVEVGEKQKHKKEKKDKRRVSSPVQSEVEVVEEEYESPYSRWSTANILSSEFNATDKKFLQHSIHFEIVFSKFLDIVQGQNDEILTTEVSNWTYGRTLQYFKHVIVARVEITHNSKRNQQMSQRFMRNILLNLVFYSPNVVELIIESVFAIFRIYVSREGYRVSITDFTKYVKGRKVYLEVTEPISDIKILKEKLQAKHLNIFPERDAIWYMSGYFSEKHLAAEFHTYCCMSLYATSLKFRCSMWNKLSERRSMVLKFGELRDFEEDLFEIRIRPEDVTFVDIKEVCTDLETIELEYTPTWRNLEWYSDLNYLITSTYVNWSEMRMKDANTIYFLENLLQAVRPLSCS